MLTLAPPCCPALYIFGRQTTCALPPASLHTFWVHSAYRLPHTFCLVTAVVVWLCFRVLIYATGWPSDPVHVICDILHDWFTSNRHCFNVYLHSGGIGYGLVLCLCLCASVCLLIFASGWPSDPVHVICDILYDWFMFIFFHNGCHLNTSIWGFRGDLPLSVGTSMHFLTVHNEYIVECDRILIFSLCFRFTCYIVSLHIFLAAWTVWCIVTHVMHLFWIMTLWGV